MGKDFKGLILKSNHLYLNYTYFIKILQILCPLIKLLSICQNKLKRYIIKVVIN